jgi:ABC-type Fe3+-hydroxamate transport system substrate-binding protein
VDDTAQQRQLGPDRRAKPRGGRREGDQPGSTPLVMVADEESPSRELSETILARLHFAVAPVATMERAVELLPSLRPDVIVAQAADVSALQRAASSKGIPFVVVSHETRNPDALVEAVREAIRAAGLAGTSPHA